MNYVKFTLIDEIKKNVVKAEMMANEFVELIYKLQLKYSLDLDRNEDTGSFEVIVRR